MRRPRADPLSATAAATASPSSSSQHRQHRQSSRQDSRRGSRSSGSNAPYLPRIPRYHINHFDTGGMPVSLWGMDRRDVWRTCFCFHVRTVTIFIGVWYLMIYILELSFNAALLMYEPGHGASLSEMTALTAKPENMLPTPVSKIDPEPFEIPTAEKLTIDPDHRASRMDHASRNNPLSLLDSSRKNISQVILLTVCNMLITLLMVFGAVRGKPSYLMPFFVLRVFDFCIFCLTMVSYFSYLPNVTEGLMSNHGMPFRETFITMDRQILSFIALIFIVAFIAVKAYIIGVIWNCYKYLMLRNTVIRGVIAYRHDDPTNIMGLQQNLLPDLPDYDTAVNDPRYAKKPPTDGPSHGTVINSASTGGVPGAVVGNNPIGMPPPPPYSVAVASEPVYLVMPMAQQNENITVSDATANIAPANVPQSTTTTQQSSVNNNNVDEKPDQHVENTSVFVPIVHPQSQQGATSVSSGPEASVVVIDKADAPSQN